MNYPRAVRILVAVLVCALFAPGVWAQHVQTKVENAEVVYVEGNDVVLKSTGGEVRQFEIPDTTKFTVDSKAVTVHELKPGMKLTAVIVTMHPPMWVDTVEVSEVGTVWKSIGSNLIVKTPDGENKMYRVPSGGKITLNGVEKTLDQLREGDKITATIVRTKAPLAGGGAQVHHAPATPARVGALLIDEGAKPSEPSETSGSPFSIILIVLVVLVAGLVLLAIRRKRKA